MRWNFESAINNSENWMTNNERKRAGIPLRRKHDKRKRKYTHHHIGFDIDIASHYPTNMILKEKGGETHD